MRNLDLQRIDNFIVTTDIMHIVQRWIKENWIEVGYSLHRACQKCQ